MLTLDLDPAALLKAAAQMTNEYGCEVVITKNGNLLIRPAAEKRTSTERVRKHREAKRLAETSVMKAVFEQCETSFNDETHETSEPVSSAFATGDFCRLTSISLYIGVALSTALGKSASSFIIQKEPFRAKWTRS